MEQSDDFKDYGDEEEEDASYDEEEEEEEEIKPKKVEFPF